VQNSTNTTSTPVVQKPEEKISLSSNAMEVIDEIQREEAGETKKEPNQTSIVQNQTRNTTVV
jgi:hypothetical protein